MTGQASEGRSGAEGSVGERYGRRTRGSRVVYGLG